MAASAKPGMQRRADMTEELTPEQIGIAQRIAAGDKLLDITADTGVARTTIHLWRSIHPQFQAKIREFQEKFEADVRDRYVSQKHVRIGRYVDILEKLDRIMTARGLHFERSPDLDASGGGETGVIVRQYKAIGTGPMAEKVTEYATDAVLLREYRAYSELLSKELGQWVDRQEHSGVGGGPIIVREVVINTPAIDLPEDY